MPTRAAWRPKQPETDRNGVPITEGCALRRTVAGSVLPGICEEGIASYLPGDRNDGVLYIRTMRGGREAYVNAWNQSELEVLA